jgi:hypothetical protein
MARIQVVTPHYLAEARNQGQRDLRFLGKLEGVANWMGQGAQTVEKPS